MARHPLAPHALVHLSHLLPNPFRSIMKFVSGALPDTEYRVVNKVVLVPILIQLTVELGDGHKVHNSTDKSIITKWHVFLERK